jgi:hypothetical protein
MQGIFVLLNIARKDNTMRQESKDKKEKWVRPKLTVLTKGESQESALGGCKRVNGYGPYLRQGGKCDGGAARECYNVNPS